MVEQLHMRLSLHDVVGFKVCTLCEEGDIAVKYIYLLPLLTDYSCSIGKAATTNDNTHRTCGDNRKQRQACFLFKILYQHNLLMFLFFRIGTDTSVILQCTSRSRCRSSHNALCCSSISSDSSSAGCTCSSCDSTCCSPCDSTHYSA